MKILLGICLATLALTASLASHFTSGAASATPAIDRTVHPVFIELFTSQGCSSCPPADRVLERLDREAGIVAVSRPVTYWDRLGWKDTLARAENDALQRRYAERSLPGSGVYTPEAVVQGRGATVGSDEAAQRRIIRAVQEPQPITLSQSGLRVSASGARAGMELRFLAVARRAAVNVGSGENGARRLTYSNVVLNEASVACSATAPCSADIPLRIAQQRGADRWIALLQDRNGGTVRTVRWIGRPAK